MLQDETWWLATGLQQASDLLIKHIEIQTDSAVLLNILNGSETSLHLLNTLLATCRTLLKPFDSYALQHVHWERNVVADCLAKRSLDAFESS